MSESVQDQFARLESMASIDACNISLGGKAAIRMALERIKELQAEVDEARLALAAKDLEPYSATKSGGRPLGRRCYDLSCQLAGFHVGNCKDQEES